MIIAANDVAKFADGFNRAYVMLDSQEIAYEPPNGNWERRYVELPLEGLESFRGKGSVKCRGGGVAFAAGSVGAWEWGRFEAFACSYTPGVDFTRSRNGSGVAEPV